MLYIDIKPIKNTSFNCIECVIIIMANFLKIDWTMILANGWGFSYESNNSNSTSIGSKLGYGRNKLYYFLEKYCSLKITKKDNEHFDEFFQYLEKELKAGKPVAVRGDTFYCPWGLHYRLAYDDTHYFVIIGLDKQKNQLFCIDSYYTNKISTISIEEFKLFYKGYIVFTKIDQNTKLNWQEFIKESIDDVICNHIGMNTFNSMSVFADEVQHSLNKKSEMNYTDIKLVAIVRRLYWISIGRIHYAEALKYIAIKNNVVELLSYCERMKEAAKMWDQIKNIVIKYLITDINKNKVIAEKVRKVAKYEEKIALDLKKYMTD